jgi:hypothetical protein
MEGMPRSSKPEARVNEAASYEQVEEALRNLCDVLSPTPPQMSLDGIANFLIENPGLIESARQVISLESKDDREVGNMIDRSLGWALVRRLMPLDEPNRLPPQIRDTTTEL